MTLKRWTQSKCCITQIDNFIGWNDLHPFAPEVNFHYFHSGKVFMSNSTSYWLHDFFSFLAISHTNEWVLLLFILRSITFTPIPHSLTVGITLLHRPPPSSWGQSGEWIVCWVFLLSSSPSIQLHWIGPMKFIDPSHVMNDMVHRTQVAWSSSICDF